MPVVRVVQPERLDKLEARAGNTGAAIVLPQLHSSEQPTLVRHSLAVAVEEHQVQVAAPSLLRGVPAAAVVGAVSVDELKQRARASNGASEAGL